MVIKMVTTIALIMLLISLSGCALMGYSGQLGRNSSVKISSIFGNVSVTGIPDAPNIPSIEGTSGTVETGNTN